MDHVWRDEALADLNDNMARLNYMFSQANFTDPKKGKTKGPVKPRENPFPRPYNLYTEDDD